MTDVVEPRFPWQILLTLFQMGIGLEATGILGNGIMGVGYQAGEETSTPYPSVMEEMVSQNLILTQAYSIWLNDLGKNSEFIRSVLGSQFHRSSFRLDSLWRHRHI